MYCHIVGPYQGRGTAVAEERRTDEGEEKGIRANVGRGSFLAMNRGLVRVGLKTIGLSKTGANFKPEVDCWV